MTVVSRTFRNSATAVDAPQAEDRNDWEIEHSQAIALERGTQPAVAAANPATWVSGAAFDALNLFAGCVGGLTLLITSFPAYIRHPLGLGLVAGLLLMSVLYLLLAVRWGTTAVRALLHLSLVGGVAFAAVFVGVWLFSALVAALAGLVQALAL